MRFLTTIFLASLLAALVLTIAAAASDIIRMPCPHCQATAGYCLKEVVEHRCRMVEEKKPIKKTVYECKEVPYCQHKLPKFGHCDTCPECQACPKYKKVLIKKEIVCGEKCETKCVVDEIVHKVPCCNHCQAQFDAPPPVEVEPTVGGETPKLASPVLRFESSLR